MLVSNQQLLENWQTTIENDRKKTKEKTKTQENRKWKTTRKKLKWKN